jgi:hypothetical protein
VYRAPVIAVALIVSTASFAAAQTGTRSGLRGTVTLALVSPVCVEGEPCSKPAPHALIAFRRDGRVVGRVETRADGSYRIALRPGRYVVSAPEFRRGTRVTPRRVTVPKGKFARVDLEIDTGIQ